MIRLVEDVGAPAAATVIDMLTLEMAPAYNEMADYIMTGAGYLGGFFLKGTVGNFLASMGAASLPLTARAIRERVKSPVARSVGTSRMAFRASSPSGGVRSYPAQPKNTADNWPRAV